MIITITSLIAILILWHIYYLVKDKWKKVVKVLIIIAIVVWLLNDWSSRQPKTIEEARSDCEAYSSNNITYKL